VNGGSDLRGVVARGMRLLPETIVFGMLRARERDIDLTLPPPVATRAAAKRLLIAPANYAGQGRAWAESADSLDDVAAVNLEVSRAGGYDFPTDFRVSQYVFSWSRRWASAQTDALEHGFTHVLIEAERPVLGRACRFDVRREGAWLDAHDIARAYVSHGSDLRLPSRHAELDPWSPFRDSDWDVVPDLEASARRNADFLHEQGRPVFVSTPELLLDAPPGATWLPVVIDPSRWSSTAPPLDGSRPVVFHAPTNPRAKGTNLVAPALEALNAEGVIAYRPANGVNAGDMPPLVREADIVLDQFRVGSYGVAACEAMAAGRLVVGHVSKQVRIAAAEAAGMPLPIVEADPDTLESVLREIAAAPDSYRTAAAAGPEFVKRLHDGAHSARALASFLG